jgi:propionate CoA-transferase
VFVREANGLVVTEVAPGIDVRRDVLAGIPFPVSVSGSVKQMDAELFHAPNHRGQS